MKKIVLALGTALCLTAAFSSCSKSAGTADTTGIGDSLATTFGEMQGAQFAQYINTLDSLERTKISKDDVLRGMKETLFADTASQGYMMGLNIGMNFLSEITQIERSSNIRVDRQKLYDAFAKAVKADSLDMNALQAQMQSISMKVREEMEKAQKEKEMQRPEVKEAAAKGAAYIDGVKKNDPAVKTTASGLAYKEVAKGTGENVKLENQVRIKYTGKHIDGTTFDQSPDEGTLMYPGQLIPGFKEALLMMNKGAKYTIYIPGDIAYGVNGQPQAGIGPMETLVFDVEVLDITNPEPVKIEAAPAKK